MVTIMTAPAMIWGCVWHGIQPEQQSVYLQPYRKCRKENGGSGNASLLGEQPDIAGCSSEAISTERQHAGEN